MRVSAKKAEKTLSAAFSTSSGIGATSTAMGVAFVERRSRYAARKIDAFCEAWPFSTSAKLRTSGLTFPLAESVTGRLIVRVSYEAGGVAGLPHAWDGA